MLHGNPGEAGLELILHLNVYSKIPKIKKVSFQSLQRVWEDPPT